MKCMNFRRFDPTYTSSGRKGLTRGNKLEKEVWNEFAREPDRLHQSASVIRQAIDAGDVEIIDDDQDDDYEAAEGKVLTALHHRRGRNRTIVRRRKENALKETGELRCEGCEMTFEERYGDVGQGFIEVHHTRPVHELRPGDKTTLADLVLVCANCHRMIHRRRPWLTMGELRATVRSP
jgi:5-methylcytosine-specific restriction protein A